MADGLLARWESRRPQSETPMDLLRWTKGVSGGRSVKTSHWFTQK